MTAAWLHGLDVEPCDPIDVTVPKGFGVSARSGVVLRRSSLNEDDVVIAKGWRATSIVRTLRDVCGRVSITEAVVIADMALHARLVDLTALKSCAAKGARRAGVVNFRRAINLAEPASESLMESRLRMLLVLAGLSRPRAQVSLVDRRGRFLGRTDLYYPDHRLGLEYDGGNHRDRLAEDNRRQNRLVGDEIRLLRFTAGDILRSPDVVVAQVRAMLMV
jgi:very-short-patch-repair endonuclease